MPATLLDAELKRCLHAGYGVHPAAVEPLALGADPHSAVFRVLDAHGAPLFLKLRAAFEEPAVTVPLLLAAQGLGQVLPPILTRSGQPYASVGRSVAILYPYLAGADGFTAPLAEHHWVQLGRALRQVHITAVPPDLAAQIPCETYSPLWREQLRRYFAGKPNADEAIAQDASAAALRAFLDDRRAAILALVARAEQLAAVVSRRPLDRVLCHGDIHAGNVLATGADLYIVDWDTVTLAPKERDLMFVGGGVGGVWNQPQERTWFYAGYGPCEVDPAVLAYYRFERIVQDIAVTCDQLLESTAGTPEARARSLADLTLQFEPGNVVEIAYGTGH